MNDTVMDKTVDTSIVDNKVNSTEKRIVVLPEELKGYVALSLAEKKRSPEKRICSTCFHVPDNSPYKFLEDDSILQNGVVILGAYSHTGKTTVLTELAVHILKATKNCGFLLFAVDDDDDLTERRIASQISGKNFLCGTTVVTLSPEEESINEKIHTVLGLTKIEDIEKYIKALEILHGYENIVVAFDYLQKLQSSEIPMTDPAYFLEQCMYRIKEMLLRHSLLFLGLSQMTEGTTRNAPPTPARCKVIYTEATSFILLTTHDERGKEIKAGGLSVEVSDSNDPGKRETNDTKLIKMDITKNKRSGILRYMYMEEGGNLCFSRTRIIAR